MKVMVLLDTIILRKLVVTLDSSDGISEEPVWWDSMDWGGGMLVVGHSYEDDSNGGMSVIEVSGNLVYTGTVIDQTLETSQSIM